MSEQATHTIETASVRRSPKYSVFVGVGVILGIVAALILTFAFNTDGSVSPNTNLSYASGQVFGFLLLVCIPIGIALMCLVALIFDRSARGRTTSVRIDREQVTTESPSGEVADDGADRGIESDDVAAEGVGHRDGQ